jgi:hypothetical protein
VTPNLKSDGIQTYQEYVGILQWAVEIRRVDTLLETSLMPIYLAMPREGHLQQLYRMFGYLKLHPKRKIVFDLVHPKISKKMFVQHEWHDFYRDISEVIPGGMPSQHENPMLTHQQKVGFVNY